MMKTQVRTSQGSHSEIIETQLRNQQCAQQIRPWVEGWRREEGL